MPLGYPIRTLITGAVLISALAVSAPAQAREVRIREFRIPSGGPRAIAAGPDGNLWFTEERENSIGRITPSGKITEFQIPSPHSRPGEITAGPDGNLWFTEESGNKIDRITPVGQVTDFPLPIAHAEPESITAGPDGDLWFTERTGVGRITTSGQITDFPLSRRTGVSEANLSAGPEGDIWFSEGFKRKIGRITPSGQITQFEIHCRPECEGEEALTSGPEGDHWFTIGDHGNAFAELLGERQRPVVGRITPSGEVREFVVPGGEADGISAGPEGDIWFTEWFKRKIGRITPGGLIAEFHLPHPRSVGIAAGVDGSLWFAGPVSHTIGRIAPRPLGISVANTPVVKNGWTRLRLDCSGGAPHAHCRGTLRLEVSLRGRHIARRFDFAPRRYRMPTETTRWVRVRVPRPDRGPPRRFPPGLPVIARATVRGGQVWGRMFWLRMG
jgi:virginiamycin B lyase